MRAIKVLSFIFIYLYSFSQMINNTNIVNHDYENIFNFYCDKLKDRGINLDIYYTISSNNNWKEELEDKFNSLQLNKDSLIGIFFIDRGILQFKTNSSIVDESTIDRLIEKHFQFEIENMEYVMKNGQILKKVNLDNIEYISKQVILAGVNLLYGLFAYLNCSNEISKEVLQLIKDPNIFDEKLKEFFSENKESKVKGNKKEKEKRKIDTSNFKIGGASSFNSKYKTFKGGDKIDPLTGLKKKNYLNEKEIDFKFIIKTSFEYNNVLIESDFLLPYYIDFSEETSSEKSNTFKLNKLTSKINYEFGHIKLGVGKVDFNHSKNILNHTLSGYQLFSLFESENRKLFVDYIYIPKNNFLNTNEGKEGKNITSLAIGIKNNMFDFKYLFAESIDSLNVVQEISLNTKFDIKSLKNRVDVIYSLSNNKLKGNKWFIKYFVDFIKEKNRNISSSFFIKNFSKNYSATDFSEQYYDTNIPKYIDKQNAKDQYGFGMNVICNIVQIIDLNFIFKYYKKRDIDLSTYTLSSKNRAFIKKIPFNLEIDLNKDSFEYRKLILLKNIFNIKRGKYSATFTPEYEYKNYSSKNKYSKHSLKLSNKSYWEDRGRKVSLNSKSAYSISDKKIFFTNAQGSLLWSKKEKLDFTNRLIFIKKRSLFDKFIFYSSISKNLFSDYEFFGIFNLKNMKWNINVKGLINLSSDIKESSKEGLIDLYIPFESFGMENQITINSNRFVGYEKESIVNNINLQSLKKFKKIKLEFTFENHFYSSNIYSSNIKNVNTFEKDKSVNNDINFLISDFNKNSIDMEPLISNNKSKIFAKSIAYFLLNNLDSSINISAITGLGIEKIFKEKNTFFIENGLSIDFDISDDIKSSNVILFDLHSNYKKVFKTKMGIYILKENMKSINIFKATYEDYIINLLFTSKGYFTKEGIGSLEYDINYIKNVKIDNQFKLLLSLNTDVMDNKDNSFINSSDLFINISINHLNNFSYSLSSGGNLLMMKKSNNLSVKGTIVKNDLNYENSEIAIENIYKLSNDFSLLSKIKYSSNIPKNDNDFTIYQISFGVNISRFIVDKLSLSLKYIKEYCQYPEEFKEDNKDITEGEINVNYNF